MKIRRRNSCELVALSLCVLAPCAIAQDNSSNIQKTNTAPEAAKSPTGILPVPDYSGDFWTREYLTGDWGGDALAKRLTYHADCGFAASTTIQMQDESL